MDSPSDSRKLHRHLLPVVAICFVVVFLSFSGCLTGLPGLSGFSLVQGSGSSAGTANPPAYDTSQAQATQAPATGTAGGSCRQGLTSCSGNCVDTTVDIGNCGGCGMVCPSNAQCKAGACYCKEGYEVTNQGTCTPATAPAAETANTGQNQQYSCAQYPGTTACNDGYCWYLTEVDHCGSCDNTCAVGQTCVDGQCTENAQEPTGGGNDIYSCNSNSDCAGIPTDSTFNQYNFAWVCSDNRCIVGCQAPLTACYTILQGMPLQLVCADPKTDESNCGSCGHTCATGATCTSGSCACPTGYVVLNGKCVQLNVARPGVSINPAIVAQAACSPLTSCNGACLNLQTDEGNCGSCGHTCGSTQICLAGKCGINPALLARTVCAYPLTSCNGNCVNTQSDTNNCGSCGTKCPTGGSCSNGVCACPTGYINSNGVCSKLQVGVTLSSYKRIVSGL